jgi:hypothetical protein
MTLPVPPGVDTNTSAPGSDETTEDDDKKAATNAIKQFGASEDAEGNPVPVPTVQNIDVIDILTRLQVQLNDILAERGVTDVEAFIEEAEAIDKTLFPGNKQGRVSYNTIRGLANLFKQHALWTKQRGVGGTAALKSKIAEKDNKIAELEAKMAALLAKLGMA